MVQVDSRPAGAPPSGDGLARRRRILNLLLGGSFFAWMAVLFYPVLKYLKRPPEASGGRQMTLSDEEKKKVAESGFAIVRMGTERVIVFEDARKNIHALQAKCTHEGCTVTYKSDESLVWCACHNGKFALDGRVISGPPPRPLAVYAVEGDLGGKVTISIQGA
ncbi:MAG: Rieske (2Fe-2S) protein [Acidobacteriota bacterium]